ncbi:MAG: hypothetical protein HYV04_22845 [Deltaproteobacteria bacterium]|nr:hypothetical protein [Deltaproteobacteria bacterium]
MFSGLLFFLVLSLFSIPLFSGCIAIKVGGEIQAGRNALLRGEPEGALAHFRRAAELNPDYILDFAPLPQGVWTYVGRSLYAMDKLPEAQEALERARSRYDHDDLARLYLGLVLMRAGDRRRGLNEISAGLRGLLNWLEYMDQYHLDGRYWDPGRRLRLEIENQLGMIEGKDIPSQELIDRAEWLGAELENEIDVARREMMRDLHKKRDRSRLLQD